jgi:hypothetical protein
MLHHNKVTRVRKGPLCQPLQRKALDVAQQLDELGRLELGGGFAFLRGGARGIAGGAGRMQPLTRIMLLE